MAAVAALMSANLLFCRQPGNANNDVVAIALLLSAVALLLNSRWPGRSGTAGRPPGRCSSPGSPPASRWAPS